MYLVSVLSFGCKGIAAFLITYWLANALKPADLAAWAAIFSFGMILSVADFGVGQLVLTTLHERNASPCDETALMTNAVAVMSVVSLLLLLATSVAIECTNLLVGIRWAIPLVAVILLRLVLIPYGAFLQAVERYHERKIAEAIAYLLAAIFVRTGIATSVSGLLLGVNAIITLGSVGLALRARHLDAPNILVSAVTLGRCKAIIIDSFAYFVNNISGLAIYGGFIALSSMILPPYELARLALLHSLLFMHLYQLFELMFRTVQTRMSDPNMIRKLKIVLAVVSGSGVVIAGVLGGWVMGSLFHQYRFSAMEMVIYAAFIFLEVYFLMITSAMQMQSAMKPALQWLSYGKAGAFLVVLSSVHWLMPNATLFGYAFCLAIYSALLAAVSAWVVHRPRGSRSPEGDRLSKFERPV
jgi:hypothetical protein